MSSPISRSNHQSSTQKMKHETISEKKRVPISDEEQNAIAALVGELLLCRAELDAIEESKQEQPRKKR